MRKEMIEHTYYQFDELSDKAKDVARDWFRNGYGMESWWECMYEDAANVGLKILSFDDYKCEAKFMASAEETAHKIEKEHGESCETFKDAKEYLTARDNVIDVWEKDENGEFVNQDRLDISLDALDSNFLLALQEDYRIMLNKEYEYLMSNESVDENIKCNEYEFSENGRRA